MYQQSVDRADGSSKKDLMLFVLLIVVFFLLGSVMLYIENISQSLIPRYVFIGCVLLALYLLYRFRLVGYRYTVFYKELDPIYEPKLDPTKPIESPYPIGTVIFERIVSAKGTILVTLSAKDIISIEPCGINTINDQPDILNVCVGKKRERYLLTYRKNDLQACILFSPNEEFLIHLDEAMKLEVQNCGTADE